VLPFNLSTFPCPFYLFLLAVHLKHGDRALAVDLVAGRVLQPRLAQVVQHLVPPREEGQVKLRKVEFFGGRRLGRQRAEVPRLHFVPPQLDALHVLDFRELLVLPQGVRVELGVVLVCVVVAARAGGPLAGGRSRRACRAARPATPIRPFHVRRVHRAQVHRPRVHPLVHAAVEFEVVHIVLVPRDGDGRVQRCGRGGFLSRDRGRGRAGARRVGIHRLARPAARAGRHELGRYAALDDAGGVELAVPPLAVDQGARVEGEDAGLENG